MVSLSYAVEYLPSQVELDLAARLCCWVANSSYDHRLRTLIGCIHMLTVR